MNHEVAGKAVLEWIRYAAAQMKALKVSRSTDGGDLTMTTHSGAVVTLVRTGRRFHVHWESGPDDAS